MVFSAFTQQRGAIAFHQKAPSKVALFCPRRTACPRRRACTTAAASGENIVARSLDEPGDERLTMFLRSVVQ